MTDISVIVPTYNHAHFLDDCLASIYSQRGVSMEIIVVDDGSSDHTAELAKKHSEHIKYIYKDNAGLSAARNTGVEASSGRYIQFLDADDILAPNCLEQKLRAIERHDDNTILVCRSRIFSQINDNGAIVKNGHWRLYTSNLNTHLCRLNIAPPHAYFLPRTLTEDIAGFDESYKGCEDYDFWLRALGAGYNFHYCPDALVYYRKHVSSMGNTKARAGIYPFDITVHKKKHEGSYGAGVNDLLESLAGKLALADGALATALLINTEANPQGQQQLLNIASVQIEGALGRLSSSPETLNLEARLYLKRILLKKNPAIKLENSNLPGLIQRLNKDCGSAATALSGVKMMFPITRYEKQALMYASLKTAVAGVFT